MLRWCRLLQCPVQYTALSFTTGKLNALLDMRTRKERVSSEVLKQYIRSDVMPILRATSLDRRHDSAEMRRSLSQLLRDSTFAAIVLRARPGDAYVSTLINCIKHDHERMQFIHKMTSNQASRVIEHLCRLGVKDSSVYAALAARLDFNVLKEIARAMFALTEGGMYNEVVSFIVPLYCGEKWAPQLDGGEGFAGHSNRGCNLFEAVRLIRVLSKSVRGVVEQQRFDKAKEPIYLLPTESIQQLRTNLTAFIIENGEFLRGGHWINFTRAMVHFPQEFKTMKNLEHYHSVVQAVDTLNLPHRDPRRRLSNTLDTDDMAAYGMHRIFAPVEQQQQLGRNTRTGEKGNEATFDVPSIDLTKLLSIIEEVPASKGVQQRRLHLVIDAIVRDMNTLHITGLVRFIQALRRIEGSSAFVPSLNAAVSAVSRLLEKGSKDTAINIPRERLVQLAALLTAFRVKSCKGLVSYLSHFVSTVYSITVEDATSFMNVLATISNSDGVGLCSRVGGQVLEKMGLEYEDDAYPLLLSYPLQCAKLLRATVLLNAAPPSSALKRIFGSGDEELKVSPALRALGASVLFDVARSLYHFCRIKPVDSNWEETLWVQGMLHALLPLLTQLTSELCAEVASVVDRSRFKTYVPLAWRSTMEAVFIWVDVNLDTVSLTTMQQRIKDIYPFTCQIVTMAVGIARAQLQGLEENSDAEPPVFSANSIVHLIFFLLMLEHLLYHGTWQVEINVNSKFAGSVKEDLHIMKEDYNRLLTKPVCKDKNGNDVTALTLINQLFPPRSEHGQLHPLLDRNSILEITTNLPFAVSLEVSQGPINELFCDRAVAAMICDNT